MGDLLGGSGLPVGIKKEIEALGQTLDKWGSCSPRDPGLKNRGCNHFVECIFGFKAVDGPHNVGVYIKSDTGASVEREMPCHVYMETLHRRAMESGETGEVIAVVAHEGDTIEVIEEVPKTPRSKDDARMKRTTIQHTIKPFPRPGQEGSAMGPEFMSRQKIEARLKDRTRILRQLKAEGIDPAELVGSGKASEEKAAVPSKRG